MTDLAAPPRQTSDPDRRFPVRRVAFDEDLADLDAHFATDDDVVLSHLLAVLSGVFPDGEEMFVESVKHYRDEITDPDLQQQVNAFIGQEVVHGRQHRALNARLGELGYRSVHVEQLLQRDAAVPPILLAGLNALARLGVIEIDPIPEGEVEPPPLFLLALTAALEHYTATMANLLLTDAALQSRFADDALFRMWAWHAIEESEHKAVAFDVYRAVGGDEQTRTRAMRVAGLALLYIVGTQTLAGVLTDRRTWRRGGLVASLRRLPRNPLLSKRFRRRLADYHRPDFHPDDHDTTAVEDAWRRWFDEGGPRPAPIGS